MMSHHDEQPVVTQFRSRRAQLFHLTHIRATGLSGRTVFGCLALLCFSLVASAQTAIPTPSPSPAPGVVGAAKKLYAFYQKITPKHGFRLVTGSVAPGGGQAPGLGYGWAPTPSEKWALDFHTSARVSLKKYWEIDSNLRLTKASLGDTSESTKIDMYGVVKDMPRLDFFGIGPTSREQDRAVFHYRETAVGLDIVQPVERHIDLGGAIEGIFPRIIRITNPTVRSVERAYSEATAPGISSQPNFLHLVGYAELHGSETQAEARRWSYKFFYHFFRDGRDHLYSFRRFDADLSNKFPFGKKSNDFPLGKNEFRIRGRLSFSDTSPGQRVPFYLMNTLGGSNIRNIETLRGFRDYRFRDRDQILVQLEYMRDVKGPFKFVTFYDTGKVAPAISRFDVGRWRHTYGLGLAIVERKTEDVIFRFYVAFGSGEGTRTYLGQGSPLDGRGDRLLR